MCSCPRKCGHFFSCRGWRLFRIKPASFLIVASPSVSVTGSSVVYVGTSQRWPPHFQGWAWGGAPDPNSFKAGKLVGLTVWLGYLPWSPSDISFCGFGGKELIHWLFHSGVCGPLASWFLLSWIPYKACLMDVPRGKEQTILTDYVMHSSPVPHAAAVEQGV